MAHGHEGESNKRWPWTAVEMIPATPPDGRIEFARKVRAKR